MLERVTLNLHTFFAFLHHEPFSNHSSVEQQAEPPRSFPCEISLPHLSLNPSNTPELLLRHRSRLPPRPYNATFRQEPGTRNQEPGTLPAHQSNVFLIRSL